MVVLCGLPVVVGVVCGLSCVEDSPEARWEASTSRVMVWSGGLYDLFCCSRLYLVIWERYNLVSGVRGMWYVLVQSVPDRRG